MYAWELCNPLVASSGSNAGMQNLAITIRTISTTKISSENFTNIVSNKYTIRIVNRLTSTLTTKIKSKSSSNQANNQASNPASNQAIKQASKQHSKQANNQASNTASNQTSNQESNNASIQSSNSCLIKTYRNTCITSICRITYTKYKINLITLS